jgi:ubiquitin-protein ligase
VKIVDENLLIELALNKEYPFEAPQLKIKSKIMKYSLDDGRDML